MYKLLQEAKENPGITALAAVGAAQGIWKYYIKPELTAKRAWIGLGAAVVAYDLLCPDQETLSDGVDRGLEQNRLLTTAAVGYTALHLLNVLPPQVDIFKQFIDRVKPIE